MFDKLFGHAPGLPQGIKETTLLPSFKNIDYTSKKVVLAEQITLMGCVDESLSGRVFISLEPGDELDIFLPNINDSSRMILGKGNASVVIGIAVNNQKTSRREIFFFRAQELQDRKIKIQAA